MSRITIALLAIFVAAGAGTAISGEPKNYVKITKNGTRIRTAPSTSSPIVTQARAGDVFELKRESSGWYGILMFSGEYRYIHNSLAEPTEYRLKTPPLSTRQAAFRSFWEIEGRTQREADEKYSVAELMKNIDYGRLLNDRYKLEAMHRFGIQPPLYLSIAVEGTTNGWYPK